MTGTANLASQIHQLLQIGTSRTGGMALQDSGIPEPLRTQLQSMPVRSDEERLWLTLGALDLWQRAGHAPVAAAGVAEAPCDVEILRPCPPAAVRVLEQLLRDVQPGVAPRAEWLQLAARHGCRVPAALLPAVLALATRHRELRDAALPVLGERGTWLARRHPDWGWAGGAASDSLAVWQTGDAARRVALLKAWRHADPAAALAALQADWAAEPPELRAALLPCLAVKLGLEDAPFLETALDDKRKEVRAQAQALLAALPASPLAQRALARITPLLRLEPHVFSADRLRITLPDSCDKAMQRDGAGLLAHPGMGEKAGWLADLVAATPLAYWHTLAGDPRACVKLAAATEFEAALVRGWALAVRRQGALNPDAESTLAWFTALAQRWVQGDHALRQHYPRDFFQLFSLLPARHVHALLASTVEGVQWNAAALPVLELLETAAAGMAPGNWPQALSHAVVSGLRQGLPALAPHAWAVKGALPTLALALDPRVADSCAHGWPELDATWPDWADHIGRLLDTLRFRRQMTLSFEEQTL